MALPGGFSRRYAFLGGFALFTLWLWLAFDKERTMPQKIVWHITGLGSPPHNHEFDVFNFPPVDSDDIRAMCMESEWNSTLVFTCDNNHGGIGHLRNSILSCVRYAIAAGGSLVLPRIAVRDDDGMMDEHDHGHEYGHVDRRHGGGRKGLDYMFDLNHFADSLRMSCPQLTLIRHMEETAGGRRRGLSPEGLFSNVPATGLEHPQEWPAKLNAWIEKYMAPFPRSEPIIIDLEQSFLHYPTHSDGHHIAHSFGNILKFRSDVRRLATTTLNKMSDWYNMGLNLSEPIINPSFLGAHLMTENPFLEQRHEVDVVYSHYESQTQAYLEHAKTDKIPLIYVASGNVPQIHKFGLEATQYNIAVTHKEDLLKEKDMEELENLKWDQRALVDYLVLLKAQEFAGVGHSSFSWQIAMTRHEYGDKMQKGELHGDVYSDGLSTLYGVRSSYVDSSLCMWS